MSTFSDDLYSALGAPSLDSINFLSDVFDRYPRAISFAPGTPNPTTFEPLAEFLRNLPRQDAQQ